MAGPQPVTTAKSFAKGVSGSNLTSGRVQSGRYVAKLHSMARHQQWHIRGWAAYVLAPVAIVAAIAVQLVVRTFGLKNSADLTAEDVAGYLEGFIEGRGGDWDWDDFTSIPITDPALDAIRQEAGTVQFPIDDAGDAKLRELLTRARSLQTG